MSNSILKLHQNNINQLKGHIKARGASTIHGDGNIYPHLAGWTENSGVMNHSRNNAVYSNPDREEAMYYKTYHSIDEVPATVEELEKELIAERFKIAGKVKEEQGQVISNSFEAYEEPAKKAPAKSDEEKAAEKLAALKGKVDAAEEKATAAQAKAEADGAGDKDKKAYETARAAADKLTEEYNKAIA